MTQATTRPSVAGAPIPVILFAGPSLYGLSDPDFPGRGIQLCAPARRGDIGSLTAQTSTPGTIILADGIFHSALAVGHAELRQALELGWSVWGVSSMGAIRAAEMRTLGMRGFGQVWQRFVDDGDFADDEVCLLHAPMAPWFPLSEPLIHMRLLLAGLRRQHLIPDTAHDIIIDTLKHRWFGLRTLDLLADLLAQHADVDPPTARRWLASINRYRVKNRDLAALIEQHFPRRKLARGATGSTIGNATDGVPDGAADAWADGWVDGAAVAQD